MIIEKKHFNYATFTELVALINSFVQDRDIVDKINIRFAVPHESFRIIDSGIRSDSGAMSEDPAKEAFIVQYDDNLSVTIVDQTELDIKESQETNENG